MPTAGKLAAALAFMALGWAFSVILTPLYPDGMAPKYFVQVCLLVGLIVGWRIVGQHAGRGYNAATAQGLTGAGILLVWILFFTSLMKMLRNSTRNVYDGPTDAVLNVAELMFEQGRQFLHTEVAVAWVIGGLLAAFATEAMAQRYP